jgi:hypothetical protein
MPWKTLANMRLNTNICCPYYHPACQLIREIIVAPGKSCTASLKFLLHCGILKALFGDCWFIYGIALPSGSCYSFSASSFALVTTMTLHCIGPHVCLLSSLDFRRQTSIF